MKKNSINLGFFYTVALLSAALMLPQAAQAIGVLLPNQDPEAIARGNAFAATADNPSAIYYNPAGISQLSGFDFELEDINYLGINGRYSPAVGPRQDTDFQVTEVPQFFATYSPTNLPLSFGLGFYSPFGLGTEWPGNGSLRTLAIESRMTYLTLSPVVAWQITPTLSISAGPTFNYSRLKIRRGLFTDADQFTFKGEGEAYGGTAGILWQPTPKWSLGLDYRSETRVNYGGNSVYLFGTGTGAGISAPTTANAILPTIVSGGISFRPTKKWNMEFDVDYINWDSLNSIGLNGTAALFHQNLALHLNWEDSWQYKFGVTRYFDNGWFVSAGYFYSSQTAPEAYYTPAVPDTELHTGSIGFGHHGEHWSWALTGQLIMGPERTITTEPTNVGPPPISASPAGKYQLIIPSVDFSVSYRF
ncbi:MAG TPA: outer membrane protein transport protein [Candidatus Sulfotelmatobacter sp.]|jgi:long-chain fatty acid transport protein|nr:outer membrane protein transport protein [Candidatus Sulfotelmatobacter sp.]